MLEVHHRILASSHDPPWDTDDYRSLGHTPDDDGVGADPGVVTHYYGSEQDRGRANDDIVANRRVTLGFLEGCPAEDHALVHEHVIGDLGGLSYDHARAVVDEEPAADDGTWVDLDRGQEASCMRDETCQEAKPVVPQEMRHPVEQQRVNARIEK